MIRMLIAAAALALSACATVPAVPPAPVAVASQTALDEKGAIAAETAYTAAARAAALAIRAGLVSDPAMVQRIGKLDRQAYAAVQATRAAYDAGNASSYVEAFTRSNAAVRALLAAF